MASLEKEGQKDVEAQQALGPQDPLIAQPSPETLGRTPVWGKDAHPSASMDADYHRQTRQQKGLLLALCAGLLFIACVELGTALPQLHQSLASWHLPGTPRYPTFLVLGDWGRGGEYNQSVVAEAMARKARDLRPDFIVSTGDNFYEAGLVSADDPFFDTSFVDIYSQPELAHVPWHVALGNHDYGETKSPRDPEGCTHASQAAGECFYSPLHQLDVRLAARDPRWHCERTFTLSLASGNVDVFFIDTTPMMRRYEDEVWADNRGGVLHQSWEDQVRELEARLARSQAAWKVVVGHHPIRTNHRPDHKFQDMIDILEPVIMRYGVQAYLCGHDHNLQYIHNPERGYHQVTSGAGSATGAHFYGDTDSPFQYGRNGFVAVTMGRLSMRLEFMGVDSDEPLFTAHVPLDANN